MKKYKLKNLAKVFDEELQEHLPLVPLTNGVLVYKNLLIKNTKHNKWGVFDINNKELIGHFFLKSCALLFAKEYISRAYSSRVEVKLLDEIYWSNYNDSVRFNNLLTKIKYTDDRYLVTLTRLEYSTERAKYFKNEIFKRFNCAFG